MVVVLDKSGIVADRSVLQEFMSSPPLVGRPSRTSHVLADRSPLELSSGPFVQLVPKV